MIQWLKRGQIWQWNQWKTMDFTTTIQGRNALLNIASVMINLNKWELLKMAKTFRWDDKQDPRKDTQKAKQDQKQAGRKSKEFLKGLYL